MNKSRFAFVAVIVVAGLVGFALAPSATAADGIEVLAPQNGIEVLGIEVLDTGASEMAAHVPQVPAGSFATAVMVVNGSETIVDAAPIDPATGNTHVKFPATIPGNHVRIHAPSGTVLYSADYVEGVDFD